ncbi:copper chaperone PCu(A)C [Photobacterium sp.]|uniref:copper chaperone PCu(A)C n=1 Tax=Photobacterium sp. TaxID=660 RepID=UPI00299DC4E0|nr:copper chaperone PCu(A)C [Photobacterium sp.]MDX1302095.1 copper chaperone PCu(A)C [Photobacterium sp.]
MKYKILALSCLLLASTSVYADLMIDSIYARATPPGVSNSAIFMTIINHGESDRNLVAAKSDIAENVELHNHTMVDGMMQMRQVDSIAISSHGTTILKPGGLHVMLLGLKHPLKEGEQVVLTLHFADGSTESMFVPVQKVMAEMKGMQHDEDKNPIN